MEHLRTRWAALAVALLLLLSVAGVAGASGLVKIADESAPVVQGQGDEQGDQGENADEDQNEDSTTDTTEDQDTQDQSTDTTEDTTGAQGEHGAIVSDVAQNKTCVGGEHMNHGWAVSQVAQGLQAPTAGECPVWTAPQPAAAPTTTDTTTTTDVKVHGKSAQHRQDKANKGHHGHP
jgi:hypothetical protein